MAPDATHRVRTARERRASRLTGLTSLGITRHFDLPLLSTASCSPPCFYLSAGGGAPDPASVTRHPWGVTVAERWFRARTKPKQPKSTPWAGTILPYMLDML